MKVKEGIKFYTLREFAKIAFISDTTLKRHINNKVIIPTDIEKSSGRKGFRYLFSEDEIQRYCDRVGIAPHWEKADKDVSTTDANIEHEKKVIEAQREIRRIVDPAETSDKGVYITEDNVHEIFGNSRKEVSKQEEQKQDAELIKLNMFGVKLGKAYITASLKLSKDFDETCWMQKDCAEGMSDLYGGRVVQLCAMEIHE